MKFTTEEELEIAKRLRQNHSGRSIDLGNGQSVSGPGLCQTYIEVGLKERAADLIEQQAARIAELESLHKAVQLSQREMERTIAELEKDAARYRWLRKDHWNDGSPFVGRYVIGSGFSRWIEEHADAAIDTAMAQEET